MAYTANGALIDARMAHAPASTAKSALVVDLKAYQTELQTQIAALGEVQALSLESRLLELAEYTADALKDHED
jgi:hypothetical protein